MRDTERESDKKSKGCAFGAFTFEIEIVVRVKRRICVEEKLQYIKYIPSERPEETKQLYKIRV